ncbi:MAG: penicillin acylase family protein, partial [Planctomycetota bacterium]
GAAPAGPAARALAEIGGWDGDVGADATVQVVLDAVRAEVRGRSAAAFAARTGRTAGELRGAIDDEALLRIFESRTEHLLPAPSPSWKELASDVLAAAATASLSKAKGREGEFRTRGEDNRAAIRHPAASSLGAAARIAEMPRTALPGHPTAIRVQTPSFGASQRSIICPVHLGDAIMVTPCGQAGMPTSPHFRSLHGPWEQGVPFPLVPSEPARIVELVRELPPKPPATTP